MWLGLGLQLHLDFAWALSRLFFRDPPSKMAQSIPRLPRRSVGRLSCRKLLLPSIFWLPSHRRPRISGRIVSGARLSNSPFRGLDPASCCSRSGRCSDARASNCSTDHRASREPAVSSSGCTRMLTVARSQASLPGLHEHFLGPTRRLRSYSA